MLRAKRQQLHKRGDVLGRTGCLTRGSTVHSTTAAGPREQATQRTTCVCVRMCTYSQETMTYGCVCFFLGHRNERYAYLCGIHVLWRRVSEQLTEIWLWYACKLEAWPQIRHARSTRCGPATQDLAPERAKEHIRCAYYYATTFRV